jgi:hypothetical protein
MNVLRLTYEPEDEFHGELSAHAEISGFSAQSSAWFNRDVIEAFAAELANHPLSSDTPAALFGGVWDGEDKAMPSEIHLGILIAPHSAAGELYVELSLAASDNDCLQRAALCFTTEYASVDQFRTALIRMLDDPDTEAVLTG